MRLATAFFSLTALFGATLDGSVRTSANYSTTSEVFDSSGSRVQSSAFILDETLGDVAGVLSTTPSTELAKQGYIGQLYDAEGLVIGASSLSVNGNSTDQLSALAILDDSTSLVLSGSSVGWNLISGPVQSISPTGLLLAGVVGSKTAALVKGSFLGLTGTFAFTIVATANSYAAWQSQHFTGAQMADPNISGGTANPSGDGVANLMKYALNLNPGAVTVDGLPRVRQMKVGASEYLALSYTQVISASDVAYVPQVSGDLIHWNSGASSTMPVSATSNGDGITETVVVRDTAAISGTNARFMRLEVTGSP